MANARSKLAVAAGMATAGTLLVASMAAAAPPPARDTGPFCVNVPDGFGGFNDIAATGNEDNIECLAYSGITTGVAAGVYNPTGPVSRGQMATFVARMIDAANDLETSPDALQDLPEAAPDAFGDDNGLQPHEANINRLAAAGIVSGTGGGNYSPSAPVSRAQMATFINNAHGFLAGNPFSTNEDYFVDDEGVQHEANINAIASQGVVQGVTATTYVPSGLVSRNQMASFIIRYLAALEAQDLVTPLPAQTAPGNATLTVEPDEPVSLTDADNEPTPDINAADNREYTVSGLAASQAYRIRLVQASNITNTNGTFTFADADNNNVADLGTPAGAITAVNNAPVPPVATATAVPVNGVITFSVDVTGTSDFAPVVFVDADLDTQLDLDDAGEPTEDFGVGGTIIASSA